MNVTAPYDERNQADYIVMTGRIESALELMRSDSSIPATEHSLATLANCSRGTLRNRVFPLEKLKEIKRLRIKRKENKPIRLTTAHRVAVDIHLKDKKVLSNLLEKSRNEAALWFDKYLALEAELELYRRTNEVLQKKKAILEERNLVYEKLLREAGISFNTSKLLVSRDLRLVRP